MILELGDEAIVDLDARVAVFLAVCVLLFQPDLPTAWPVADRINQYFIWKLG